MAITVFNIQLSLTLMDFFLIQWPNFGNVCPALTKPGYIQHFTICHLYLVSPHARMWCCRLFSFLYVYSLYSTKITNVTSSLMFYKPVYKMRIKKKNKIYYKLCCGIIHNCWTKEDTEGQQLSFWNQGLFKDYRNMQSANDANNNVWNAQWNQRK